jgi:hypothetical protein
MKMQGENNNKDFIKKCSAVLLVMCFSMGFVPSAMAFGDDAGELAYLIKIYDEQMKMYDLQDSSNGFLGEQLDKVVEQMGIDAEHWSALTSAYGMSSSDLVDEAFSSDDPSANYTEQWSADSWDDALKEAAGGNSDRYETLKATYKQSNPTLLDDNNAETIDAKKLVDTGYKKRVETNNMALAASQTTYEDVNQRIRNLKELIKTIDQPEKNANEKAAIDLNSRLVAEVGLIQLEMLRLQSIQAQVDSSEQQDIINHETIEKQMLGLKIEYK